MVFIKPNAATWVLSEYHRYGHFYPSFISRLSSTLNCLAMNRLNEPLADLCVVCSDLLVGFLVLVAHVKPPPVPGLHCDSHVLAHGCRYLFGDRHTPDHSGTLTA